MAGNVRCTRCSKTLPRGGAFCRRCGWPTKHAVAAPGEPLPALTPPGFFPPLPPKEKPALSRRSGAFRHAAPANVAVTIVLVALVVAGFMLRSSYRRTRTARAATPTASDVGLSKRQGTWRVVQSQRGRAVRDFLEPGVKQLGDRGLDGTPLPDDAVRALDAAAKRSGRGLECLVTNHSGWTVHEVCVEARTWQDEQTTSTQTYRVATRVRPGKSSFLERPIPAGAPSQHLTEFQVVSAVGEWTQPRGRR